MTTKKEAKNHIVTKEVFSQIRETIGSCIPETGGILGSSDGSHIDYFYFDETANVTGATYEPDRDKLNRVIQQWYEEGIEFVGFVHSHPRGVIRPSSPDNLYTERIMKALEMEYFVSLIVQPHCSLKGEKAKLYAYGYYLADPCRYFEFGRVDETNPGFEFPAIDLDMDQDYSYQDMLAKKYPFSKDELNERNRELFPEDILTRKTLAVFGTGGSIGFVLDMARSGVAHFILVSGTNARYRINCILSALRTLEAAGVRIYDESEKPTKLNNTHVPWHFPLKLSVKELAGFLMLPSGDEELPGMSDIHPRAMYPPTWYREPTNRFNSRSFGTTLNTASSQKLSISPEDSLEHTILLGPTGSGKSTAMLNLILSDINAGRSVLVIDPKADLVTSILERIPASRADDVVVIDPSDDNPVGFNPLALPGNPTLMADAILAVFKEIFSDSWGVRSQDVLSAALLTLVDTDGASLLWLPPLLTDENFRHKITEDVKDKITLKPFWDTFDNLRPAEREQWVAPVLNKMRQFLFRPGLRGILGQSNPKFQLTDLFSQRKIVLVPLNRGTVGAESARLLGSLVVGLTWTLALSRANVAPERRHLVSLYIDELQDYLTLPTDLSDALAQARGLGVGITMAHQYRAQLPYEIRAGIDANARNKIIFGLNASDAREIATMAPGLEALDFMLLPRYQIYTNFMSGGRQTGWIQGKTIPAPLALHTAAEIKAKSQTRYGRSSGEIEAEYLKLFEEAPSLISPDLDDSAIGRRKI